MPQFLRRKFIYFLTGFFLLNGVFLFSNTAQAAGDTNVYNKPYNGTLTATEWNHLFLDFANTWLPVTMKGPVTIGTSTPSSLTVNGTVTATNFSGTYTGTLGAQNVSSGAFGSNTGGGNYSFPGNVGIGTIAPATKLNISGNGTYTFAAGGLSFGDGDTGFFEPGDDSLYVQIAGTAPYRISSGAIEERVNTNGWSLRTEPPSDTNPVFTFYDDFGTGMGRAGASIGSLIAGGVNVLNFNSSGRVGVGVTNPGDKLEVSGDVGIMNSGKLNFGSQLQNPPYIKAVWNDNNNTGLEFHTFSGAVDVPALTLSRTGGNVGIGTTNPLMKLHITGDYGVFRIEGTAGGNRYFDIGRALSGVTSSTYLGFNAAEGSTAGYQFMVGSAPLFTIKGDGNVGIGTSSPASKLTLAGGDFEMDHNKSIKISSSTVNTTLLLGNYADGSGFTYGTSSTIRSASLAVEGDVKADRLCIEEDCKAAWSEIVFAGGGGQWVTSGNNIYNANTGNVGVGTSSPLEKLTISKDLTSGGLNGAYQLVIRGASDYRKMIGIGYDTTNNFGYISSGIQGSVYSPIALQVSGGNVGIGTTSPGQKLGVVDGNISVGRATSDATGVWISNASNSTFVGVASGTIGGEITGSTMLANQSSRALQFGTSNSVRATISSSGNFGIGTTSPTSRLSVVDNAAYEPSLTAGAAANFNIARGTAGATDLVVTMSGSSPFSASIQHRHAVSNNVSYPIALNPLGGGVGIGTTNPVTKLDVRASSALDGITLSSASGGSSVFRMVNPGVSNNLQLGTLSSNSIDIITNNSSKVTISDPSGNVGIGTTAPRTKLDFASSTGDVIHVAGGQVAGLNSTPTRSDHAVPLGHLEANYAPLGSGAGGIGIGTSGQTLRHNGTSWVANSVLFNNGTNIGIGTTTPVYPLDVVGRGAFSNGIVLTGTPTSGSDVNYIQALNSASTVGFLAGTGVFSASSGPYFGARGNTYSAIAGQRGMMFFSGGAVSTPTGNEGTISFSTTPGSGTNESIRMLIGRDGNVGIGTTTLTQKLHIAGGSVGVAGADGSTGYKLNSSNMALSQNGGNIKAGWVDYGEYFQSTLDGSFSIWTAGSERLSVNQTGNVGIGTTNPVRKLHVSGAGASFKITDTNITDVNYNSLSFVATQNKFHLGVGSVEGSPVQMTIDGTTGNVGIGTTSPVAKLAIGTTDNTAVYAGGRYISGLDLTPINPDHATSKQYVDSNFAPIGTGVGSAFVQGGNSFGTTATLGTNDNNLLNIETNNTVRMTVAASGYVGIGITNPASNLDINSLSSAFLRMKGTGNDAFVGLHFVGNDGALKAHFGYGNPTVWNGFKNVAYFGSIAAIPFVISTSDVERMRISASGYVGIGTTNPAYILDVVQNQNGASRFQMTNTNAGSSAQVLWQLVNDLGNSLQFGIGSSVFSGSSAPGEAYLQNNAGPLYFRSIGPNYLRFGTNGQERMRFDGSGNIGIATTNPLGALHVAGTQNVIFNSTGNVGIATTSPVAKLAIGTTDNTAVYAGGRYISGLDLTPINPDHATSKQYVDSNFAPIGTGVGSAFVQGGNSFGTTGVLGTNDNNPLNIETNNTVQMTVTAGGNVGIGTTGPNDIFHISNTTDAIATIQRSSDTVGASAGLQFKVRTDTSDNYYGAGIFATRNAGADLDLHLSTQTGSGAIDINDAKLTILSTGNVGIGTTTPGAKLNVVGTFSATASSSSIILDANGDVLIGI